MIKDKFVYSLVLIMGLFLQSHCSPKIYSSANTEFFAVSTEVAENPNFKSFVTPYKIKLEAEMNTVIGQTKEAILKTGTGETPIGNLVADLQKEYAEEHFGYSIDISIINNGGIRNTLPQGNITLGNIFEISPFDNYLYVLELSAEQVVSLAEFAVHRKFLGINGLFIESQNGELTKLLVNGKPVEEGKTYFLAVNDYLANGGDGMDILSDLPRKEQSTVLLRELLIDRIKLRSSRGEIISAQIEGRQNFK